MTLAEAARVMREAVRDKSYQLLPLGEDVADYLRHKRKRLTDSSYRSYEGTLDKLARDFPDLRVEDFEPPAGAQRLEEFLDNRWGDGAPGTYNVCLAHVADFFKYWRKMGRLQGDPCLLIERARKRDVLRTVFTGEQRHAILAAAEDQRDRVALRLLLDYGLRKGALRAIRFKDFDWQRRQLTIFTKGAKIRTLPLSDATLWTELERLIQDVEAQPSDYLMCLVKPIPVGAPDQRGRRRMAVRRFADRQMSSTAMHRWWYRQLEKAGIVATGETSGERMHKARHTAGQRVLDATGDLKLTQRLLGHASIQTTGDIYVDYDNATFAAKMAEVLRADES
jgi:integrase